MAIARRLSLRSVVVVLAAIVASLVLLPDAALARESTLVLDERSWYLAQSAMNGTLTDEEREEFIHDYYELAALTPDGAASLEEMETTWEEETPEPEEADMAAAAAAIRCATVSGTYRARSTVGFTLVNWKHKARFCWDGRIVTSVNERQFSFTDVDTTLTWKGLVGDTLTGVGRGLATSRMQGHFQTCVVSLCTFNTYPWVELKLYGDGRSTWSGGQ